MYAAAAAKLLQSCLTLCNPIDGSPPGPAIPGILQARTLEWVANSFSNTWKWKVKVKLLNHVQLLATPWTAAHQAPPSMRFSRQEYWSGVPLPSPSFSSVVFLTPEVHRSWSRWPLSFTQWSSPCWTQWSTASGTKMWKSQWRNYLTLNCSVIKCKARKIFWE